MNERAALEFASEHMVVVSEDWNPEHGVTRFRVGCHVLTMTRSSVGVMWQLDETCVYIRSRGNAIKYCVDLELVEQGRW